MEFVKDDKNKNRPDLLPARAVQEVSGVLAFGANKYGPDNWRRAEVEDARARYIAAALRHILEYQDSNVHDPESGLHHLAHAATSLLFIIEREI